MSHRPVLYCTSYATTAELHVASDNWNNGDFAFSVDTFSYYTYNEIPIVGPGIIPSVEGGSWVPFTGGAPPPASTSFLEQDYPADPSVLVRDAVYMQASGLVNRANANSMTTAPVLGFVSAIPAPGFATVRYAGQLGGFVGLVAGSVYYLGTPDGMITANAASIDFQGFVVQRVGVAASAGVLTLNVTANLTLL